MPKNNFTLRELKSFSKSFDKKFLTYISNIKTPEKKIKNAIEYFIKTGGKRIRPFLIYKFGNFLNVDKKILLEIGISTECIHLHSLVHDDLPAMDDDDYRRGKLTVHKKFDEAIAVLTGDMFNVLGYDVISNSKLISVTAKIKLIQNLVFANGLNGLIGGQSLDLYMPNKITLSQISKMHSLKTGALFNHCFGSVVSLKKLNTKKIRNVHILSNSIGLIFQLTDDMLDRWGDEKKVGKKIHKDQLKPNMAYQLSYDQCLLELDGLKKQIDRSLDKIFTQDISGKEYFNSFVNYLVNRAI